MKGESYIHKLTRYEQLRWNVAYAKINLGLSCKEIADRLNMSVKMVEYHWHQAQRIIRGKPLRTL